MIAPVLATFQFTNPGPLVDGDLELVPPEARWVDDLLAAYHHPWTVAESPHLAETSREPLVEWLREHPFGRSPADPSIDLVPQYNFSMRLSRADRPLTIAGGIGFRVAPPDEVDPYLGHIGYNVYPAARGHHYAERACRLLFPLARHHGLDWVWITCNPDNFPSRRTCERLGGEMVEVVPVPAEHPLHARGETHKCRYRVHVPHH